LLDGRCFFVRWWKLDARRTPRAHWRQTAPQYLLGDVRERPPFRCGAALEGPEKLVGDY